MLIVRGVEQAGFLRAPPRWLSGARMLAEVKLGQITGPSL